MKRCNVHNPMRARTSRSAFTLIELLLVISILILLLAIGVPAFSSMLYSSSQSLSQNALRSGLSAARDLALRSDRGEDAAAVFFYEPGGRVSIVACSKVGQILDLPGGQGLLTSRFPVAREVFVPESTVEVVQLPQGWTVRGYAPPAAFDAGWYDRTYGGGDTGGGAAATGHWVLPETGFYQADKANAGRERQTFMVRFEGGTGVLLPPDGAHVLVFSPSPSSMFRNTTPWNTWEAEGGALLSDPKRYVRRVLASTSLSDNDKRTLLGDISSDTVLARAVGELAVMNENRLAAGIGVRADRSTGTIYAGPAAGDWVPRFVAADGSGGPIAARVNRWVLRNGQGAAEGDAEAYYASDARIFTIQRYLGSLQEIALAEGGDQ